jgi:hypothetical protein
LTRVIDEWNAQSEDAPMKNNPFVIFVTAFLVVMGSGLAIAAIGGPTDTSEGLDESSFAVDFGGELASESEAAQTTVTKTTEVSEKERTDAVESPPVKEQSKNEVERSEPKKEAPTDESTWIEILAPTDGQVFGDKSVAFEGKAEPGAKVYAGEYQADINDDGVWRIVLFLAPGSQTVELKAVDAAGNRATDSVSVSLETVKAEEKPKSFEFTVHQKYVESYERFEKFYGTGTPGMGVLAKSEYGTEDARVGENGEWRLPIEFSGLSETTTFPITISTTEGFSGTYWFTYVAKSHEFTVHQKFVESHEPFEKFYGTGTPGMGVVARSEFGVEDARVGENGEWLLPIEFSGLSETKTFPITISTTEGFSGTYWFTYVAKVHDFTANQKYGSCSENPPYDVFWGTGVPGTVVEVGSPYGTGRAEVGEAGHWEVKVVFESAPVGETFDVVVGDSLGNTKGFSFTRLDGEPK